MDASSGSPPSPVLDGASREHHELPFSSGPLLLLVLLPILLLCRPRARRFGNLVAPMDEQEVRLR
jgi:hypothetical protein